MKTMSKMKGGADSAWSYVMKTVGDGDQQFNRTVHEQPGANIAARSSNAINPIGNPNAQTFREAKGGRRRRSRRMGGRRRRIHRSRRMRRGGNLAGILAQGAVPATLLAMQQSYRRRRH